MAARQTDEVTGAGETNEIHTSHDPVSVGRTLLLIFGGSWLLLVVMILTNGHAKTWSQWVIIAVAVPLGVAHLLLAVSRRTALWGAYSTSIFLITLGSLLGVLSVEVAIDEIDGWMWVAFPMMPFGACILVLVGVWLFRLERAADRLRHGKSR